MTYQSCFKSYIRISGCCKFVRCTFWLTNLFLSFSELENSLVGRNVSLYLLTLHDITLPSCLNYRFRWLQDVGCVLKWHCLLEIDTCLPSVSIHLLVVPIQLLVVFMTLFVVYTPLSIRSLLMHLVCCRCYDSLCVASPSSVDLVPWVSIPSVFITSHANPALVWQLHVWW